jgi:hypothetical protein
MGRLNRITIILNNRPDFFGCSDQITENSRWTSLSEPFTNNEVVVFGEGKISTNASEFAIIFTPEMDEVFLQKTTRLE